MEFLSDFGLFLAKVTTVVLAIGAILILIHAISQRQRGPKDGRILVTHLNDRYEAMADAVVDAIEPPELAKQRRKGEEKTEKKAAKARAKAAKKGELAEEPKPRLYVLVFDGDISASATDNLREEVSAIVSQLKQGDEVLLRLESQGGMVHSYGLAASQLRRLVDAGASLTIAVDKVAASGGYMMACVAQRIVAAPFAVIGSIGVVAQLPNFHRLLKQNNIDYEMFTAGEYKRTVTLFGENTDKGRQKFTDDLEETHQLFKDFIRMNRPSVDIERLATGEVWYGSRALEEGLIDEVSTSDALIQSQLEARDIYEVRWQQRKNWQEKLGVAGEAALQGAFLKIWQQGRNRLLP